MSAGAGRCAQALQIRCKEMCFRVVDEIAGIARWREVAGRVALTAGSLFPGKADSQFRQPAGRRDDRTSRCRERTVTVNYS